MTQCLFQTKKHAVLNEENEMTVIPIIRCIHDAEINKLFCDKHIEETKNFQPSAIMDMCANAMKEELKTKRGMK
jgi:hypothetical protein